MQGWLLARDLLIAGLAATLFSLWVTFAAGYSAVYQAMVVVLAGIILYAFIRACRERLGQVLAPADLAAPVTTVTRGGDQEERPRPSACSQRWAWLAAGHHPPAGASSCPG